MLRTTHKTIVATFIASMGLQLTLNSCTSEITYENTSLQNKVPVLFSGEFLSTRVSGNSWDNKDPIGIYMKKTGETLSFTSIVDNAENKKHIYSEADLRLAPANAKDTIYYPPKDKVDFIAYHPYRSAISNYLLPVDVSQQSIPSEIDLLYSHSLTNVGLSTEKQKLVFEHQLSKLKLVIQRENGISAEQLAGAKITVENVPVKASFSLVDGTLTVDDSSTSTVNFKTDANMENAEAILLPGSCLNKVIALTTRAGVRRTYIIQEQNWEGKTEYHYTLKVERQIVSSILEAEITPWLDGGDVSMDQSDKETNASVWDGESIDMKWYNKELSEFTISSAAEFAGLSKLVNDSLVTFKGKTIKLLNNLNLNNLSWTPIAQVSEKSIFEGTFDGGNFSIFGFYLSEQKSDIASALFAQNHGTIKNLSVDGSYTVNYTALKTQAILGGIVGKNYGTINHCKNYVNILQGTQEKAYSSLTVGGVCGRNMAGFTIEKCQNYGDIQCKGTGMAKGAGSFCGGISAFNLGNITDCSNSSKISITGGRAQAGGISGVSTAGSTIQNCRNSGPISATTETDSCFVGGILGSINVKTNTCEIRSSINSATVSASSQAYAGIAGGIVGFMKLNAIVGSCQNTVHGTIDGTTFSGGIAGYMVDKAGNCVYTDCDNGGAPSKWIGNITGDSDNSGSVEE